MGKFTNDTGIPLPLAVWLAVNEYEHDPRPNVLSVTTLLKPVRKIILESRATRSSGPIDISTRLASRLGTAVHNSVEHSWTHNFRESLEDLGYPSKAIARFKINPTEPDEDDINVYLEKRSEREVGNWIISGQFDMVYDGSIMDIKSTSTYTYTSGNKDEDYINQLSMYRWLNPDIITDDVGSIQFIFKDFSPLKAMSDKNYPSMPVLQYKLPLKPVATVQAEVSAKLLSIEQYADADESVLPLCTDKELGRKPSVWKHYASAESKRASRVFNSPNEAYMYLSQKGKGIIKEVKGETFGCKFCQGKDLCSQFKGMVARGEIKP